MYSYVDNNFHCCGEKGKAHNDGQMFLKFYVDCLRVGCVSALNVDQCNRAFG